MPTLTITLSPAQHQYIQDQMRANDYDTPDEYFHDLIRAEQKRHARETLLSTLAKDSPHDNLGEHHHDHPQQA